MSNLVKERKREYKLYNKPFQMLIKRIFDILLSIIILMTLLPLFLLLALMIILDDGRPIIFKQKRSGLHGKEFDMYKFRSMKNRQVPVKSNSHQNYNWKDGVPDNFVFKTSTEENPNITRVGKVIRKYSLDELPQFYNVLKGDMSIVGPRPEIIQISRFYNETQKRRLEVKPGITGLAQVNGRSEMDHGKKIELDLYYVENFSLWLDIKIIINTISKVIKAQGSV